MKKASQAVLDLIKPPKASTGEDEEEEEEEEEKEQAPIPDFMAEASLLEWAGFGLGKEKTWEWHLSIQALATGKELTNVRFWGVINGTKKDYYIVEAKLEEYPEEEEPEGEESKNEPLGVGANECIYFVTNSTTEAWTQLPAVKASHVILATQMKRFFTGDLNAVVLGFPRFPYGELAYLRAQIARITAGAFACPVNVFTVDPEDEEETVNENEEYAGITPMLCGPETWVHGRTHLLKEGRTTAWVDPAAEEEDDEEDEGDETEKKGEEKEKPPKKLSFLGADGEGAWKFAVFPNPAAKDACAAAICTRWPGAVSVAQGKAYINFYVGYGHKLGNGYQPPNPPIMAEEYTSGFDAATAEAGATDPFTEQTDVSPPEGWSKPEENEEEEEDDDEPQDGEAEADAAEDY